MLRAKIVPSGISEEAPPLPHCRIALEMKQGSSAFFERLEFERPEEARSSILRGFSTCRNLRK
jgi:hypothetical protein